MFFSAKQLDTDIDLFIIFYTGKKKGLAGLLTKARKAEWKAQGNKGEPPALHIQGCQDHIINLMSKDYEAFIVKTTSPYLIVGQKHRATDLVQMIIGRLRRDSGSFRTFMRKEFHITKGLLLPRISDTRFVKTLLFCIL